MDALWEPAILRRQNERLALLAEAAAHLLATDDPEAQVQGLFERVAQHLGVDTYFNFMVDEEAGCLRLDCCAGVPDEVRSSLRRLEYGQAICGTVAETRCSITAEYIQTSDYDKAALVRGLGIRSYCCHPLIAGDRLLGTLSFASHTRDRFEPDEVDLLRTVCHYVAMAKERGRLLREARAEVERRRQAEEAERRSKMEVEQLNRRLRHGIRETHHRIKNNLQIVAAMADMQASGGSDTVPVSEMQRIVSHVRSLATIHDVLTEEARTGLADGLSVQEVLGRLVASLQMPDGRRGLLRVHSGDVRLQTRQATSLAIVLNELVTNAVKHGQGDVEIRFGADSSDGAAALMEVTDRGPGFAEGFGAASTGTYGLELVEHLVRWDLGGQVSYHNRRGGGAAVQVRFAFRTG